MQKPLSKDVTKKQLEIINFIHQFRFLNRQQIQLLLGHRSAGRVNSWLLDLVDKRYLGKIYNPNLTYKRPSAVYFLKPKANTLIKSNLYGKYFYDHTRGNFFINHYLACAQFYLSLNKQSHLTESELTYLPEAVITEPELKNFLRPDGLVLLGNANQRQFFIEIDLETSTLATFLRKIDRYIEYAESNYNGHDLTWVLVICKTELRLKKLLLGCEAKIAEVQYPPLGIKFTTFNKLESDSPKIWQTLYKKDFVSLI